MLLPGGLEVLQTGMHRWLREYWGLRICIPCSTLPKNWLAASHSLGCQWQQRTGRGLVINDIFELFYRDSTAHVPSLLTITLEPNSCPFPCNWRTRTWLELEHQNTFRSEVSIVQEGLLQKPVTISSHKWPSCFHIPVCSPVHLKLISELWMEQIDLSFISGLLVWLPDW